MSSRLVEVKDILNYCEKNGECFFDQEEHNFNQQTFLGYIMAVRPNYSKKLLRYLNLNAWDSFGFTDIIHFYEEEIFPNENDDVSNNIAYEKFCQDFCNYLALTESSQSRAKKILGVK